MKSLTFLKIGLGITLLFSSSIAKASCDKPVTYLKESTPSPCNGYLFTPEKEQELQIIDQENKTRKQIIELQIKKNDILADRINLYQDGYKEFKEAYQKEISKNDVNKIIYFFGGVATTYLLFKVMDNNK